MMNDFVPTDHEPPAVEAAPELRRIALEMALRTPGLQGSSDVLWTAKRYIEYILKGDQA
jgi:hypothetical protein